ncbi:MAG TPA: CvpA family protein [Lactobacillaceae bacterium]|jgi:uncharacterized membrane protein required for colicin V production
MILEAIVGLILVLALWSGFRVGFLRALARLVAVAIVWYIAIKLSKPLAQAVFEPLLPQHKAQFVLSGVPDEVVNQAGPFLLSGLAFAAIMLIGGIVARLFLGQLKWIKKVPVLGFLDALAGALIYGVIAVVILFFALQLVSVWPNAWLQDQLLAATYLTEWLNKVPVLSDQIYQWWL